MNSMKLYTFYLNDLTIFFLSDENLTCRGKTVQIYQSICDLNKMWRSLPAFHKFFIMNRSSDDITGTVEPMQIVTIYRNRVGAASLQFYRNDLSDQLYRSDKQLGIGPA